MSVKTIITIVVVAAAGWYVWRRWGAAALSA